MGGEWEDSPVAPPFQFTSHIREGLWWEGKEDGIKEGWDGGLS